MIDLHTYIYLLLAIATAGMWYIFRVMYRQIKLFRIKEEPEIQSFRRKLFALSLVIVIMGLIPISINVYTLFNDTSRPKHVKTLSLVYSAGVHLQSLFLSYILWRIYRLSDEEEGTISELETKHLEREEAKKRLK